MAANFCTRCGSPLVNGQCPKCSTASPYSYGGYTRRSFGALDALDRFAPAAMFIFAALAALLKPFNYDLFVYMAAFAFFICTYIAVRNIILKKRGVSDELITVLGVLSAFAGIAVLLYAGHWVTLLYIICIVLSLKTTDGSPLSYAALGAVVLGSFEYFLAGRTSYSRTVFCVFLAIGCGINAYREISSQLNRSKYY